MSVSGPGTGWTHRPTSDGGARKLRRRRIGEQIALLSRSPLFEGLSKSHLRAIADVSGARRVKAGETLVKEGAAGAVFFVIVEGTAKVMRGRRTVGRLGPEDFFGEMSILTHTPRSASVVADTDMECLTVSGTDLRAVLLAQPAITLRMLTTLAERLQEMDRRVTS
jgi:CRP-like cAMP-binding protein